MILGDRLGSGPLAVLSGWQFVWQMKAFRDAAGLSASMWPRLLLVIIAFGAGGLALPAQQLRGVVRDSATQQPIAGAVVSLLDARDSVRARLITSERGQYSFVLLSSEIRRVRVQRIGFRAQSKPVPPFSTPVFTLDVVMAALPTMLAPMQVAANACPKRSDQGAAASLLEQARTGLLATVVARESNSSDQLRIMFDRVMAGAGNRIQSQKVQFSTGVSTAAFVASYSAADFVRRGFVEEVANKELIYHAPDADVLLDDNFVSGYCFQLAEPVRSRPNNVGLAFRAARSVRDRVDVEGALWIDTIARAIREIEFRYRGLPREIEAQRPGGSISFREMTNGIVLIDHWSLRLISATIDSAVSGPANRESYAVRTTFHVSESGGVLARASWPDGFTWRAPLGSLQVTAMTEGGTPAIGVRMKLADSDYSGVTDSTGRFTIENLVAGPFRLVIPDPHLGRVNLHIETPVHFVVAGDSVLTANVRVVSAASYVAARCSEQERFSAADSLPFIVGRVTAFNGATLEQLHVSVSREVRAGVWQPIDNFYRPGTDGLFFICSRQLRMRQPVRIELRQDGRLRRTVSQTLTDPLTVIGIPLSPP